MNDFEGFEIPELSDQDMQGLEPLSLGDSKAENPGLVKGPFNQYVPADKMVGGVTAREYYGGNQSSRRQTQAEVDEERMGVLKPISQFMNSIMSPGFGEGIVTGPINAVSNLTNAIGDVVQGKEVDVSDAWQIKPEVAAAANPIRAIGGDTDITPQDVGGRAWGEVFAGELAGVATGTTVLNKLGKIPALVRLGQAALKTRAAQKIAVKAATDRRVRGAVNFGRWGGEGLVDTAFSTLYQDPRGNIANLGDAVGLELPGRYDEETDNYLDAFGKSLVMDGVAAPLSLIGAGAAVPITRRLATNGDLPRFMQEVADIELAPYNASVSQAAAVQAPGRMMDVPGAQPEPGIPAPVPTGNRSLPPAAAADLVDTGARSLPPVGRTSFDYGQFEAGPGSVAGTFDSAISRTTSAQRQFQQALDQRERLYDMGLLVREGNGQYAFTPKLDPTGASLERFDVPAEFESGASSPVRPGPFQNELPTETVIGGPNFELTPRVKASTVADRQSLQVQRDGVQDGADVGPYQQQDIDAEVQKIDQEERKLIEKAQRQSGVEQTPIDFDTRPELSTFLAELDELDDVQIRQILRNVDSKEKLAARQVSLNEMQSSIEQVQLQIQEVMGRMQLEDGNKKKLSSTGGKRKLNPLTKQLQELQERFEVFNNEPDESFLVGDQLDLAMDQQAVREVLPNAEIEMPPFFDMEWDEAAGMYRSTVPSPTPSRSGYASVDAYREALQKFPRDLLRKMNAPQEVSGDGRIAAILKARTGRRVWSAKKEDIIDAMIEFAQKQGKFLEPVGEQLEFQMQQSLAFNSLRQTVDVDGETIVDLIPPEFPGGRGIDAAQREDFKRRILQVAIDNGEVQPDVTPIPSKVPQPEFNQAKLIDSLFADETGQLPLMFATDMIPVYKAGGKSAETMLEEIRLRYDWAELDNASKQASKEALMKKEGWDTMTWEEQKQMGLMDPFLYAVPTRERTYIGQLEAVTPRGERTYVGQLEPISLGDELSEEVLVEALAPEPAAKPKARTKAKRKPKPKPDLTPEEQELKRLKDASAKVKKQLSEDEQELARMLKQQEINCNA